MLALWIAAAFLWPPVRLLVLALAIYLGARGNKLAWRSRPFRNVEQFYKTQNVWVDWVAIFYIAVIVIGLLWALLFCPGP